MSKEKQTRLCPFKKIIERDYSGKTGKSTINERFAPCAGVRCMAPLPDRGAGNVPPVGGQQVMGPENTSREIVTFYLGGNPIADFTEVDGVLEITALDELARPITAGAFGPAAIEAKVGIPKEYRCRSRKRFVKLIMSYGFPRNFANDIARNVRLPGRAYQTALFDTLYFLTAFMGTENN